MKSYQEFLERALTTKEKSEKERIVKGMKKNKSSFEKNYKGDAENVMYATATTLAKEGMRFDDGPEGTAKRKEALRKKRGLTKDQMDKHPQFKEDHDVVTKVAKELDKAVKMHSSQSKRLKKHAKDMKEGKKNCGCGKDPCITYGKQEVKEESCGKGEYYCHDDEKCKPIPEGMKVDKKGMLVKEQKESSVLKKLKKRKEEDELFDESNADMKNFLDKKAEKLKKQRASQSQAARNNPHFDSTQPSPSGRNKYESVVQSEGAAWTKKSGKNKEGGLNEKGRKSYERENPGSDLKAPTKKVGNPRRASFCARMKGMKKKLTSKKTASDPDSRINKSLRKWNCEYEPQGTPIIELNRFEKEKGVNTKSGTPTSTGGTKKPTQPKRKDAALDAVKASITSKYGKGAIMSGGSRQQKKVKGQKDDRGTGKFKKAADEKKQTAADAKKRGFKSSQDYVNTMARYGGKSNYDRGRGLGS